MKLQTLVVDDEADAREGLSHLLEKDKDITLVRCCKNGIEAIQSLMTEEVHLLFLDIQMPQINGFEVLNSLPSNKVPAVIFTTAYDQYALKAFEVHALDYLLKPFTDQRFMQALEHAKALISHQQQSRPELFKMLEQYAEQLPQKESSLLGGNVEKHPDRLVVKSGGKIHFVPYNDIRWVEACDYNIQIHTDGESYTVRASMKSMVQKLPTQLFSRIHKSSIVNLNYIAKMEPFFNGEYIIHLKTGDKLKLSRTYKESFMKLLE